MRAVNLLPPDLARRLEGRRDQGRGRAERPAARRRSSSSACLAACVVAVAAYVLTDNTVKQRPATSTQVTAQASRRAQAPPR